MKIRTVPLMAIALLALGVVFYFSSRPKPAPPVEPRGFVWQVDMDDLQTMAISLSREGKSEAWVKHEDGFWYFDKPGGPKVNMQRWGGGIPLILSGPGANRRISESATDEQLKTYGFTGPRMRIQLSLKDGSVIKIEVGDETPDGTACYVRVADSRELSTVDYTWYGVLERLVLEPPYPVAAKQ